MTRAKGKSQTKANAISPSTEELKKSYFQAYQAGYKESWSVTRPLLDKAWAGLTSTTQKGKASTKVYATQQYKKASESGFIKGYLGYLMSAGINTDGIKFISPLNAPYDSPKIVNAAGEEFLTEAERKIFWDAKWAASAEAELDDIRRGRTVEEFLEDFDGCGENCFQTSIAAVCAYPERLTYLEGLLHHPCQTNCCTGCVFMHAWVKDNVTGKIYDSNPVEETVVIGSKEFKRTELQAIVGQEPLDEPSSWTTQTTVADQLAMLSKAGHNVVLLQSVEGSDELTEVDMTKVETNLAMDDACYELNVAALETDDKDYPGPDEVGFPDFEWRITKQVCDACLEGEKATAAGV